MSEHDGFLPDGFEPLPRLKRAVDTAKAIGGFLFHMPHELATHGSHFVTEPRGAAEQLDAQLFDHPKLAFNEDGNRWDDMMVNFPRHYSSEGEWVGDEEA